MQTLSYVSSGAMHPLQCCCWLAAGDRIQPGNDILQSAATMAAPLKQFHMADSVSTPHNVCNPQTWHLIALRVMPFCTHHKSGLLGQLSLVFSFAMAIHLTRVTTQPHRADSWAAKRIC